MSTRRQIGRLGLGLGTSLVLVCIGGAGSAYAIDSIYECNQYGGKQVVLEVNHKPPYNVTVYKGTTTVPIQSAINQANGNQTPSTTTSSGAGDTVIVCQGTYAGNISIPQGNDNLTVRSESGPSSVFIVGDGTAPVVTIDDRGLLFGGGAEGFTIEVNAPSATSATGIQDGVPGAQSTANEDEQCVTNPGGMPTSAGCDAAAPADVTMSDTILDNIITNFRVASGAAVTGIKLDNTINNTVQQNLFKNVITGSVGSFGGLVVGGFNETAPPGAQGYQNGDSTNINTDVLDNAVVGILNGSTAACTSAQGIELNGFMLDATVYNNWEQQIINNNGTCSVTGIFSNAYGWLENEQTGTLAPVNANIDYNTIEQLSNNTSKSTGVLLAPTPATANPGPQTPPPTCQPATGENCSDTIPPSSYSVTYNELQQLGTAADDEAVLGANSSIEDNNFDSDLIGVKNGSTPGPQNGGLNATNNWWGCELPGAQPPPPSHGAPGYNSGCAALVSPPGATAWAPPQTSRVEQAGDEAGDNAGQS
jgi:hypothetical protein